jgi:hypothetical protein
LADRIAQRSGLRSIAVVVPLTPPAPCSAGTHPIRTRESSSVLRLMPNVRQTAAFVAPLSSAAITAASFSASIAGGRPPRRPRRRAAASPACTRSWINDRSNCASALSRS